MATRRTILHASVAAAALVPVSGTANAVGGDSIESFLTAFLRDKTNRDLDRTMSYFSRSSTTYIDAALGWANLSWQQLHDAFAQAMPGWPTGARSYPTKIVGHGQSAVVFMTDTAGMFGPGEIRALGAVNVLDGKIVRWVDYFNGRNFGTADFEKMKLPEEQFPADFRESTAGEASPLAQRVANGLAGALRAKDVPAAAEFFAEDAVFEDLPTHVQVVGHRSVVRFLSKANLPYIGQGTRVRHVLNGGYEWTAEGPVRRGIAALELDRQGLVTRFTAQWDGSRISRDALITLVGAAVEE
nr:hypothetical protein [Kibdelosporangium sp. MJ126-NF4]CEL16177.1 hypothetical protein [Kibdelosporangium sp. MJ126-NF4]CTQ94102.1 hypothetical protein [Kibdelosporangium sp. MJ126-NF4]